ncbi:hypothetical protein [Sulfurimonas indica]|uniref:hypothetical protein n=1 Tax=Sulfurimonas indica TaxID=2508707 RepID=UPI00165F2D01|nr:hypothetical protein [Sulfurimonas indica]
MIENSKFQLEQKKELTKKQKMKRNLKKLDELEKKFIFHNAKIKKIKQQIIELEKELGI